MFWAALFIFPFLYFVISKAQMCLLLVYGTQWKCMSYHAALTHWLHEDVLKEIYKCTFQTQFWDWYLKNFL